MCDNDQYNEQYTMNISKSKYIICEHNSTDLDFNPDGWRKA